MISLVFYPDIPEVMFSCEKEICMKRLAKMVLISLSMLFIVGIIWAQVPYTEDFENPSPWDLWNPDPGVVQSNVRNHTTGGTYSCYFQTMTFVNNQEGAISNFLTSRYPLDVPGTFSVWIYKVGVGSGYFVIEESADGVTNWVEDSATHNIQHAGDTWGQYTFTQTDLLGTGMAYVRIHFHCNTSGQPPTSKSYYYIDDFNFNLDHNYTLIVNSTGYNQPGTAINRNSVATGFNTNHTFVSPDVNTVIGSYTPGPAPAGYYWVTTPISVVSGDFTAGNNYTRTITFQLEPYYYLNVNSTGYSQPGTAIYKNTVATGFNTNHTFQATSGAALAGSYSPGTAPAGYYWVTTPISVVAGDFTAGNNYTRTISFQLEPYYYLNVNSTGYNQPGTAIYKNTVATGFNTNYTFQATSGAALAGSYTPGTAPTNYHWITSPITVVAGDFTAGNNYTYTITFELEHDFTLTINSVGYSQPGAEIFKNSVSTGFYTPHTFTATTAAALAGIYYLGPPPPGYHWDTTPFTVNAGDFTPGNNYVVTLLFQIDLDHILNVNSIGDGQPGTEIFKDTISTGYYTNHSFLSGSGAALAGSYAPGTAPTGYHWTNAPIVVNAGDFTAGNNYTYSITFILEPDYVPVEMSSFTVSLSNENYATLTWVTQTETNVSGFRIYRNSTSDVGSSVLLNAFIDATNTSQMQVYTYTDEEVYDAGIYYYWLESMDFDGSNQYYGPVQIEISPTSNTIPPIDVAQGISGVFPNPFNPFVNVQYILKHDFAVTVDVFDVRGSLVKRLTQGLETAGGHVVAWDGKDSHGKDMPSGIYYIRMMADGKTYNRKAILMK
jgi:hypothetical protein